MSMDMNQATQQTQNHVPSPQLVAANYVLALSSAELQSFIYQEMNENPALDMEETAVCPRCGFPLQGTLCTVCQQNASLEQPITPSEIEYGDDAAWRQQTRNDDDEFDPTARVPAQMSLAEHLTLSLQAQFPADDAPLIEYLVGNLDEDGRLRCSTEEVVSLFARRRAAHRGDYSRASGDGADWGWRARPARVPADPTRLRDRAYRGGPGLSPAKLSATT